MYGTLPSAAGVALLPATGNSRPLFIAAVSMIAAGVVVMIASAIVARKNQA